MKIGILVGRERGFPAALIDRINSKNIEGITAEMVRLAGTSLEDEIPYRVIIDRISHEVPYYRLYLTKAVADGVIVVNNPFWWSADNKFLECVLAERLGVAVPKTVALPNKSYEADIISESLRNLIWPMPWEELLRHVGLPAVIKPAVGGGSKNVSVVRSMDDLLRAYDHSGHLSMIVQEFIHYQQYVRCFVIGRRHVKIAGYDFSRPHHQRFRPEHHLSPDLHERVTQDCLTLTRALGYDVDTAEFAIRDGVPIAIDFLNPAPDSEPESIGRDNFEWVVEHTANMAIEYARGERPPAAPINWQMLVDAVPPLPGS